MVEFQGDSAYVPLGRTSGLSCELNLGKHSAGGNSEGHASIGDFARVEGTACNLLLWGQVVPDSTGCQRG